MLPEQFIAQLTLSLGPERAGEVLYFIQNTAPSVAVRLNPFKMPSADMSADQAVCDAQDILAMGQFPGDPSRILSGSALSCRHILRPGGFFHVSREDFPDYEADEGRPSFRSICRAGLVCCSWRQDHASAVHAAGYSHIVSGEQRSHPFPGIRAV